MSIASALFSDSQSRVLRWLFGQPEREFHLSELRRLTGLGSASLQRELNRLADAGLVRSERVGNLRRFQADQKSPVYGELLGLTRKDLEPMLGTRVRVSEVLNRKRSLSIRMIRRLHDDLGIAADVLIRASRPPSRRGERARQASRKPVKRARAVRVA